MTENILVYPFDRHFLPLLRCKFYPVDWNISALISPHGWGLTGIDAGTIDFGQQLGITIESDFITSLNSCDSVLFTQSENYISFNSVILPNILAAIQAHKNIYTTLELSHSQFSLISELCLENKLLFKYFSNNIDETQSVESKFLSKINTPIVAIESLVSGLNKFEVQVLFHKFLIDKGYKSLLISSRSYASIGGCLAIPNFMFTNKLLEYQKIIYFNNFIANLETSFEPDAIILGIPGGILPFDRNNHNYFGITPFELTRAIEPDATILCMYTENFTPDYIKTITNICKYRFSSDITSGIMYNQLLIFSSLSSNEDSKQLLYNPKTSTYNCNSFDFPIYPHDECCKAFENVLDTLSDNTETEVF